MSDLDVAFSGWWEAQNGRSGVDLKKKRMGVKVLD
jgi:hypothetical protein